MKSYFLFSGAICASLVVHFGLAGVAGSESHDMAGGDIAEEIALGSTFADMVKGVNTGVATTPDGLEPNKPSHAPRATSTETSAAPPPPPVQSAQATAAAQTPLKGFDAAEPVLPLVTKTLSDPEVTQAVAPTQVAAVAPALIKAVPTPAQPLKAATPPPQTQTELSKHRPQLRPVPAKKLEAKPPKSAQKPVVKAKAPPAPSAARGNAKISAAKGQSDGHEGAKAAESNKAKTTKAKQAGSKQLRSYKSTVLRRVARARVANAGTKATVQVSLRIDSAGQLINVQVIKSSGNRRVDKTAMQKVQRAAPFSPPPKGDTAHFSIDVDIKG